MSEPVAAAEAEDSRRLFGRALGKIVSGLYIMTASDGKRTRVMLASWVQQASFDPPCISIAIGSGRDLGDLLAVGSRIAISVIPEGDSTLLKRYARGMGIDENAFDGMDILTPLGGLAVPAGALAYLQCRIVRIFSFDSDHDLYVAQVMEGSILADGKPFIHLRGNGFHY